MSFPEPTTQLSEAARLRAATLRLARRLRAIEVGSDLTPAEFSVLGTVVRNQGITASALAEQEGVNPTMLSRMLSRMTAAGVVTRTVDPSDRRVTVVAATPAGRRLHQRLRAKRASRLAEALSRLPPERRAAVLEAASGLEDLAELLGRT